MLQRPQGFFKKHHQQAPAPASLSAPSLSSSSSSSETKISKAEKPTRQNQMARLPAAVFQNILAPMLEMNEVQNLRTVHFYSWITDTEMTFWEGLTAGLGSIFGLRGEGGGWCAVTQYPRKDLAACRRLGQVRMKEYQALEPKLKKDLEAVDAVESSLRLSL